LLAEFEQVPDGASIQNAVLQTFADIAEQARQKTGVAKPADFDRQIAEHLETYWTFVELRDGYEAGYKALQNLAAGLKNTRHFRQIRNGAGEAGRKCSLDGEHNALFYRNNSAGKPPPFIQELNRAVEINSPRLRPNEGLSAASLVKRYYQPATGAPEFLSTAAIALMQWIDAAQKKPVGRQAWDALRDSIPVDDWDAQLLFNENLSASYFNKNGFVDYRDKLPDLQGQLAILDKLPLPKSSYYGLLVYDGDKMGKHLSGEYLPDKNQLREFQENLSRKLAAFAKHAKEKILIHPHGKTIYAGGDDFLGLVNLASAFPMLERLRQEFDERVNQAFQLKKSLTFSAGLVIAHYKTPLHIALTNARDLLDNTAKSEQKCGRDAFALRILKHSGESHECGFKWEIGKPDSPLTALQTVIAQLKENFSANFIQGLNQEMRLLHQEPVRTAVIEGEIKRLVGRSVKKPGLEHEKESLIDRVKQLNSGTTENFLEALNVCKFMQREIG
jgi:CRISPR-associated protein Cmr2